MKYLHSYHRNFHYDMNITIIKLSFTYPSIYLLNRFLGATLTRKIDYPLVLLEFKNIFEFKNKRES